MHFQRHVDAQPLVGTEHRGEIRLDALLIDAHFGYPDGVAAALLGRRLHCPVVITLRGNETALLRRPLRRAQLGSAVRTARVIAVSHALGALAGELGARRDRV